MARREERATVFEQLTGRPHPATEDEQDSDPVLVLVLGDEVAPTEPPAG